MVKIAPGSGISGARRNGRNEAFIYTSAKVCPKGVYQAAIHKKVEGNLPETSRNVGHGDELFITDRFCTADIADAVDGSQTVMNIKVSGDAVFLIHIGPSGYGTDKGTAGFGLDHADAVPNVFA